MKGYVVKLIIALMAVSIFLTACGEKENSSKTTDQVKESSTQDGGSYFHKYSTPIKLTFHTAVGTDQKFRPGEDINNNVYIQWAKDELGIEWSTKFVTPTTDDGKTRINLLMASGDLPDCITAQIPQMATLASKGFIKPLNDLIEKYGSPLLKDRIKASQDASGNNFFSPYTIDGKYYAMPVDADIWGRTFYNTFMRQDILDELGKKVPQTLTEFEDVLAAYKAKYPDGVGVYLTKDFSDPSKVKLMSPAMQPYGAYPGRWLAGADGKLVYGSVQPEVKKGLETLRKWYANGWIDKEFIIKDENKENEVMTSGKMLSMTGDWWQVYFPLPDLAKNNPKATFTSTSIKGQNGSAPKIVSTSPFDYAVAISSTCKNPEAFIYQLNEQVDSYLRNDTALRDRMKKEYNYEFKYPVESPSALVPINPNDPQELQNFDVKKPGPKYFKEYLHSKYWPGFSFTGEVDSTYDKVIHVGTAIKNNKKDSLTTEEANIFNDLTKMKTASGLGAESDVAQILKKNAVLDAFLGAPTATMIEKNAYLQKLENETFSKIILGASPLDDFNKFVNSWENAGGDKITEEVNTWYKASK